MRLTVLGLVVAGVLAVGWRELGGPVVHRNQQEHVRLVARIARNPRAINLPPGVVTVLRSRVPDGQPFRLTLQRIRFEGRQYVCLYVYEGRGAGGKCEGPLPLPDRPLVAVMSDPTVCKPRPAQLLWGLALTDVSVALRAGGHERTAARRSIPAALDARGDLFFIWARSAPDSLIARNRNGIVVARYTVNSGRVPVFASFCLHPPRRRDWPSATFRVDRDAGADALRRVAPK
jgi:hypothetical protein